MRRLALSALLAFASLVPALAAAQDLDAAGEAAMLDRINAIRSEESLPPLARSAQLDAVARAHSQEMASAGQLTHVSETTGTPEDRVRATGLGPSTVAENVALHRDSGQAQAALLASPPHRSNMLSPTATHVGLASLRTPGGVYVTQVFAGLPPASQNQDAPLVAPNAEPAEGDAPGFGIIPPFVEDAAEQATELAAPVVEPVLDPFGGAPSDAAEPAPAVEDDASTAAAPGAAPSRDASPATEATLRQLIGLGLSLLGESPPPAE